MDMSTLSGMSMPTASTTASTTAASSTTMSMGGNDCKISMLWNWYTIDACFISRTWQVRTTGAFAGSCIGVILLVMVLEALRRAAREHDAFIIRKRRQDAAPVSPPPTTGSSVSSRRDLTSTNQSVMPTAHKMFRPTTGEQAIRALLHMLQFAVAYFIMLLAMYYNGYIIICIFIGAYIGSFVFNWTNLGLVFVSPTSS